MGLVTETGSTSYSVEELNSLAKYSTRHERAVLSQIGAIIPAMQISYKARFGRFP
jgi:hypothetical protein